MNKYWNIKKKWLYLQWELRYICTEEYEHIFMWKSLFVHMDVEPILIIGITAINLTSLLADILSWVIK